MCNPPILMSPRSVLVHVDLWFHSTVVYWGSALGGLTKSIMKSVCPSKLTWVEYIRSHSSAPFWASQACTVDIDGNMTTDLIWWKRFFHSASVTIIWVKPGERDGNYTHNARPDDRVDLMDQVRDEPLRDLCMGGQSSEQNVSLIHGI